MKTNVIDTNIDCHWSFGGLQEKHQYCFRQIMGGGSLYMTCVAHRRTKIVGMGLFFYERAGPNVRQWPHFWAN
jgi:hypothetical protein